MNLFEGIAQALYKTLIVDDRWRFYITGIGNTLLMSALACVIGSLIGLLVAIVKVLHTQTGKFRLLNRLCNLYTTVIRGTPVLVQVLIIWYVIFASVPATLAVLPVSLAFGLNSGAYASEIVRAGILSVDRGQTEAGRSLGLNQKQTMRLIVMPQAIKNILPALFNEFITLLKETSVAGYISVVDVTRAGDLIRTRVWTTSPLFISALIYLAMVLGLTRVQQYIEGRMAASDKR